MKTAIFSEVVFQFSKREWENLGRTHPDIIRVEVEGETYFFEYTIKNGSLMKDEGD